MSGNPLLDDLRSRIPDGERLNLTQFLDFLSEVSADEDNYFNFDESSGVTNSTYFRGQYTYFNALPPGVDPRSGMQAF